jgi:hypothetical protein
MAKSDNVSSPSVEQKVQPSSSAPSADYKQPMPVEIKESDHVNVLRNPQQALLPGKKNIYSPGIIGEIEAEYHKALKAGKMELAVILHGLKMKLADFQTTLRAAEKNLEVKSKSFFEKLKTHL